MQFGLHDFFPAGKHYVWTDVFPSILLSSLKELLPDRMTEIKNDYFQEVILAFGLTCQPV
jgi:hypothetical protein